MARSYLNQPAQLHIVARILKGPLTLCKSICLFFRCFPNIPYAKDTTGNLLNKTFDVLEQIKFIIRQAVSYDKVGDATKLGRGAKFDFAKTSSIQLFSRVRVYNINTLLINHIESLSNVQKHKSILMIFCVFLSDLLEIF